MLDKDGEVIELMEEDDDDTYTASGGEDTYVTDSEDTFNDSGFGFEDEEGNLLDSLTDSIDEEEDFYADED